MEYQELIKYLKVCDQNIQTLHRHLRSTNFYSEHEVLGEYYEKIGEYVDLVVELGIANGYPDISIQEALGTYELLPIKDYTRKEAFNYVYKAFNELINMIEEIKPNLAGFVSNKLEELQYYFDIEANFKIARLFEARQ